MPTFCNVDRGANKHDILHYSLSEQAIDHDLIKVALGEHGSITV